MERGTPQTVQAQSGHHDTNVLLIYTVSNVLWARIAQSVQRLAMGWMVQGPNAGGGKIFHPGAHPASYTMRTMSFPGIKWPECAADHPPPSSAEVKGTVELYLYFPSGPLWPVLG